MVFMSEELGFRQNPEPGLIPKRRAEARSLNGGMTRTAANFRITGQSAIAKWKDDSDSGPFQDNGSKRDP